MSKNKNAVFPIMLAFLVMGFGDVVGPMVSLVKDSFQISNFAAQILTLSGFIMFGLLSIPMGIVQSRIGKTKILGFGLIIAFLGLAIPMLGGLYGAEIINIKEKEYILYLLYFSVLLLGAGATMLQVSGNPVMRDVSDEGKYSSNLSFAQSIKAIGTSLGFWIAPLAVLIGLNQNWGWTIQFPIYSAIVLITFVFVFRLSTHKDTVSKKPANIKSCFKTLKNPYILFMVIGIFFYVGAEVSMSAQIPILMKDVYHFEKIGLLISWSLFILPILIGRFLGGVILRYLHAKKFLLISAVLSIIGICLLFLNIQIIAFAGVILVGLGFSNIFPLIFSITIDKNPEKSNEISSLMVTAIVGGAFIPPLTGLFADKFGIVLCFLVPLICIVYILSIAIYNKNLKAS